MNKTLRLLLSCPLLYLSACALPKSVTTREVPVVEVSGTRLPVDSLESVRHPEAVKAYPVGRYQDPDDPSVLYEKNTAYRVEEDASWNLHPRSELQGNTTQMQQQQLPRAQGVDPAQATNPYTAEFEEELQKQKQYTSVLIEQNEAMGRHIEILTQQAARSRQIAQDNQELREKLDANSKELGQLETKFAATQAPQPQPKSSPKVWWRFWDKN